MIVGCGIDIVAVKRLARWQHFSDERLGRIFTSAEVKALRTEKEWPQQRAAAYFAAKEAFYKALSRALVASGLLKKEVFFISICPLVGIHKNEWGIPEMRADWEKISILSGFKCEWKIHCSYAHEQEYVVAQVILS